MTIIAQTKNKLKKQDNVKQTCIKLCDQWLNGKFKGERFLIRFQPNNSCTVLQAVRILNYGVNK